VKSEDKFDPTIFRDRNQITLKTAYMGIRSVYRWSDTQKKYVLPKLGNRFVAQVKQNGRQKERFFERLDDARKWRLSGDGLKHSSPKMLFEEVLSKYFEHIKSAVTPATWKTYKNSTQHLEYFYKMPVSSISSHVVDQWFVKIKSPNYLIGQHQTRFTYGKELKVLKQILKHYSEYIDENFNIPVKQRHSRDAVIDAQKMKIARMRNQSRYLTDEEQHRFLTELKVIATEEKKVFFLIACFQLMTGTRIGEAASMAWTDVDMIGGKLVISKSVHWGRGVGAKTYIQPFTKTGIARRVPMTIDLKLLLKEMNQASSSGLVFSLDRETPLAYRSIQYFYNKAFEKAGITHRSTHILRHTFSTDFITDTKDHVSLSRLLGHSSTRQTEHYAKITGNLTDESFKAYKEGSEERLGKLLKIV
jgi:integrase